MLNCLSYVTLISYSGLIKKYAEIHVILKCACIYDLSASGAVRPDRCLIFILLLETPFEIPGYSPANYSYIPN